MILNNNQYTVYSEFDLEKHKQTFINYFEAIIKPCGAVEYAVPSHQEKLIKVLIQLTGMEREAVLALCPEDYYCDFLTWLLMQTKCVSCWSNFHMGEPTTKEQADTLNLLIREGLTK